MERAQSRIYVFGLTEANMEDAIARLKRVFGIHSVSPALAADVNFDAIAEAAYELMEDALREYPNGTTFKVQARRADKSFPMRSDEINRELGLPASAALPRPTGGRAQARALGRRGGA